MYRLVLAVLVGVTMAATSGCILPAYSGDPPRRVEELIWTSENYRMFLDEWERFWFLDMPDHSSPLITHGGIM